LSIQALRAVAESNLGNTEFATQAMSEALELGATEGFVRSFLDEGPSVLPLLQHAARESGSNQRYARTLLDAAGIVPEQLAPIESEESRILSRRERDVMRLVASGLSNRDVGDTLFISEETVKTHLRRIFEKLGVSSRTQAVNMCQRLELL
jgi:LuxR family maltose regulon positive regulatory protein